MSGAKKAQASLDLLSSSMIALAASAALLGAVFLLSTDAFSISYAKDAVRRISSAIDEVDGLGEGSKTTLLVQLPAGIESFSASGSAIRMRLHTASGVSDVFANTKAQLNGTLPKSPGLHRITVSAMPGGAVQITNYTG
ncbi:MAG: hypothetical protein N3E51_03615 [Candidatus Micrarchaeota archaeon]|nr:hypothetical protein [Candidatus Micrarchaeota archaeon]